MESGFFILYVRIVRKWIVPWCRREVAKWIGTLATFFRIRAKFIWTFISFFDHQIEEIQVDKRDKGEYNVPRGTTSIVKATYTHS